MVKKRILVVDDELDLLRALQVRLGAAGYDILLAYDGLMALEKAKIEKPDLIILDLMLPKMDGYQVCRLLKFDEKYKNIPIIIFTARAQEDDKKIAKEVGADAYITKPFEPQTLLETIRRLLE